MQGLQIPLGGIIARGWVYDFMEAGKFPNIVKEEKGIRDEFRFDGQTNGATKMGKMKFAIRILNQRWILLNSFDILFFF